MRPVIVQNRLVIGWRPALIELSESDASDIIENQTEMAWVGGSNDQNLWMALGPVT